VANIRPHLVAQGEDLVAYVSNLLAMYFFFAALNSGYLLQHSTTSRIWSLSSEEELISDLQH